MDLELETENMLCDSTNLFPFPLIHTCMCVVKNMIVSTSCHQYIQFERFLPSSPFLTFPPLPLPLPSPLLPSPPLSLPSPPLPLSFIPFPTRACRHALVWSPLLRSSSRNTLCMQRSGCTPSCTRWTRTRWPSSTPN